jgi:hypothetical protein
MGFTVEQECPQCGGPIELDETDHLLSCPYCSIKNFIFAPNYFRLVLPHKAPGKEIIYAPYLRFKGNVYYCQDLTISHRFVDITRAGLKARVIPSSLGLRPQAMKMKFVTPDTQGSFLKFSLKAMDVVEKAAKLSSALSSGQISHRAFIGDTLSLIYLPLYLEGDKLFDAILNRHIDNVPSQDIFESDLVSNPKWELTFMPTICPDCGWNLDGEKDSVVLTCANCYSAWEATKGKFRKVDLWSVPGQDERTEYLPFWSISATSTGVEIKSFADFIRVTNQPIVIKKEWEDMEMSFWTPAFKIRPKLFLRLSGQITVTRRDFQLKREIPGKGLYPVTLPQTEAVQAMKLTLAGSAVNKKKVLPHLPGVKFDIKRSSLVYLPFSDTGHDMALQNASISINKQALEFGRKL